MVVSSRNIAYALVGAVLVALTVFAFVATADPGKKDSASSTKAAASSTTAGANRADSTASGTGVAGIPGAPTTGSAPASTSRTKGAATPSQGVSGHSPTGQAGTTSGGQSVPVTLTKAAFIVQANSLCAGVAQQVRALPVPPTPLSYDAITANADGVARLINGFFAPAAQLVQQTADRDQLTQSWLTPFQADFQSRSPLLAQLAVAAAKAASAKSPDPDVQRLGTQLDALPNHRQNVLTYLTGYGLSDCVSLLTF